MHHDTVVYDSLIIAAMESDLLSWHGTSSEVRNPDMLNYVSLSRANVYNLILDLRHLQRSRCYHVFFDKIAWEFLNKQRGK